MGDAPARGSWVRGVAMAVAGVLSGLVLLAAAVDAWVLWSWQDPRHLVTLREGLADPLEVPDPPVQPRPAPERDLWLLGGSSVVLPDEGAINRELEQALDAVGCPTRVHNLGQVGRTLDVVLDALVQDLSDPNRPTPDALMVYAGHNAYRNGMLGRRSTLPQPLRWTLLFGFLASAAFGDGWTCDSCAFEDARAWHRAQRVGPAMTLLQRLGLVRIDPAHWDEVDAIIAEAFATRLAAVREVAEQLDATLIVEVPVGNNEVEVFGPLAEIEALTARAAAESDPRARERLLLQRRDLEVLGADIRAKKRVRDHVRSLAGEPGVVVFDLEAAFLDDGVPMDHAMFYDHFHFRMSGHEAHFRRLAKHLKATSFCVPSPDASGSGAPATGATP